MATYAALIAISEIKPRDNAIKRQVSKGLHGTIDLAATELYDITITHPLVSKANVATLKSFWDTNKDLSITTQTLSDGNTYNAFMVNQPSVEIVSENARNVTQRLVGTRI